MSGLEGLEEAEKVSNLATPAEVHDDSDFAWPPLFNLLFELRLPVELMSYWAAMPWLGRLPQGDGHPVMVIPGLATNDWAMSPLRDFIHSRGYQTEGWSRFLNIGPTPKVMERIDQQAEEIFQKANGRKISLVGWSLGGFYARHIARKHPDRVRQIITLASPTVKPEKTTWAAHIFDAFSWFHQRGAPGIETDDPVPDHIPVTCVYSKNDGVVGWRSCMEDETKPLRENIEIAASHAGICLHPAVCVVVADRLAQKEGQWQRFEPKGWHKSYFPGFRFTERTY